MTQDIFSSELNKYHGNEKIVTIPDGIDTIGEAAFSFSEVEKIIIPQGVKEIKNEAFRSCNLLKEISLPDSLKSIGDYAFMDCSNLVKVELPDTLTQIGKGAFQGCIKLKYINIPASLKKLRTDTFFACSKLKLVIPDTVVEFDKVTEDLCGLPFKNVVYCGLISNVPGGVKEKTAIAYNFIKYLNKNNPIDEEVRVKNKTWIKTNRKKIFEFAFENIELLNYLVEEDIISLEDFDYLDSLNATAEIQTILLNYKKRRFPSNRIEKYEEARFEKEIGIKPLSVNDYKKIFTLKDSGPTSYTLNGYKGTETDVVLPEMIGKKRITVIKGIGDGKEIIKRIVLPSSVLRIEQGAFEWCVNLEKVDFSLGLREIGCAAFSYCEKLEEILIPDGTRVIGREAFNYCVSLKQVKLPSTLYGVYYRAFQNCKSLEEFIIPGSISSIESRTFANCTSLKRVQSLGELKEIALSAFLGCGELESVEDSCELKNCKIINDIDGKEGWGTLHDQFRKTQVYDRLINHPNIINES